MCRLFLTISVQMWSSMVAPSTWGCGILLGKRIIID
uniref:Putative Rho GTPase n=1 Tax=Rhizophora mucronata TaxID=61149 RepID=A0A2P2L667_RHIMU